MKKIIAKNFSTGARDYKKFATIQKLSGENLAFSLGKISGSVLDIGAGRGELSRFFEDYVALDISPKMCELAKENGVKKVVCCNAENLPFEDSSIDNVVSNFALQWMDVEKVIKEVARIIKSGGIFGFAVPVEGSLSELFTAWQKSFIIYKGKQDKLFQFPSANLFIYCLRKYNFRVLKREIKTYTVLKDSPSEALKLITGIGARNPYRKTYFYPGKEFYKTFKMFFGKQSRKFPITYNVLTVISIAN
ncbi:methyltransferase domain-containing protein [Desulfurobacterium atlanticum]|uniref:Malonyl-CoA O-methyltransferase n=1 Tax=Desulfurobacterium atlanticum TaxID=240169 RepID=A0A239A634_9BACT|nr:methyltransferase domain-containing protein [Desulfurobacterium atlanticum]SNR90548.1 malonyl-CoA O-methyltransferase [Desulfurobacterium atlanticum]